MTQPQVLIANKHTQNCIWQVLKQEIHSFIGTASHSLSYGMHIVSVCVVGFPSKSVQRAHIVLIIFNWYLVNTIYSINGET